MTDRELDAVFWDIGGVILEMESVTEGHYHFVQELVSRYETDYTFEEALDIWRSTLSEYFGETEGTNYRPARHGYERAVDAVLGVDAETVEWGDLIFAVHEEYSRPNPGAIETIERLAATAIHLGVISDVDHEEGQDILDAFGVLDHFDSFTSSEEVGRKKPDQAMFDRALEKAGVDPSHALMIGDRYTHDMKGAADAGMVTAGYGAEDGPAVDYHLDELTEILDIVGVEAEQP